ncbi:MAG: hypothetical protein Q7V62_01835 [Actinomycetota bacterium]|nr:hypothetical protein [Actinomycetota bacterium]
MNYAVVYTHAQIDAQRETVTASGLEISWRRADLAAIRQRQRDGAYDEIEALSDELNASMLEDVIPSLERELQQKTEMLAHMMTPPTPLTLLVVQLPSGRVQIVPPVKSSVADRGVRGELPTLAREEAAARTPKRPGAVWRSLVPAKAEEEKDGKKQRLQARMHALRV